MFVRLAFALAVSLPLAVPVRAGDPPLGKWSVTGLEQKGDLIIKEIGRDGKVTATFLGTAAEGVWDGSVFTLKSGETTLTAGLVVEEIEKGQTKYTLTGIYRWSYVSLFEENPKKREVARGCYAQKIVRDDNQIKTEVKGTLAYKDGAAYVSVKRDDGSGGVEETRVYFRLSETEWKYWRDVMSKLNGETVTVTGAVAQLPKGSTAAIPEGAVYFLRGFEIKAATGTFR